MMTRRTVHTRPNSLTRPVATLGLCMLLGLGGGLWLGAGGLRPAIAQAQTAPVGVMLVAEPGESYTRLIRRAETAARALAEQTLTRGGAASIHITVLATHRGQTAPLLTLATDREQWQQYGSSNQLFTYYQTARSLLQLDGPPAGSGGTPLPGSATPPSSTATAPSSASPPSLTPAPLPEGASADTEAIAPERPDVTIDIPAAPAGQLGLPRSVLR